MNTISLARRIAMAWARSGDLRARRTGLIAADSSTAGYDLRRRQAPAPFRGDVAGAKAICSSLLLVPTMTRASNRWNASALLSLIQAIGVDSSVALGNVPCSPSNAATRRRAVARTQRSRGDTQGWRRAGETRLLAGRIALAHGDTVKAVELLGLANSERSTRDGGCGARLRLWRASAWRAVAPTMPAPRSSS